MTDFTRMLQQFRCLLAVSETHDLAITAKICGQDTGDIRTTIESYEKKFQNELFEIEGDIATPTVLCSNLRSFLISNIEELERKVERLERLNGSGRKNQSKFIFALTRDRPYSSSVLPEFVTFLNENRMGFQFRLRQFDSDEEISSRMEEGTIDFSFVQPQPISDEDKNKQPSDSNITGLARVFPTRFAMVSAPKSGIRNIHDLSMRSIAGGFSNNAIMKFCTELYIRTTGEPAMNFRVLNVASLNEAVDMLKQRQLAATVYPLHTVKPEKVQDGLFSVLDGRINEETVRVLRSALPAASVISGKNYGFQNADIIEIPVSINAIRDANTEAAFLVIKSAIRYFSRYIRRTVGEEMDEDFFDPKPLGLPRHSEAKRYFAEDWPKEMAS
ncbi:MAG: hypothetical protein ABJN26_19220 [Stappiaceae bacterium]